MQQLRQKRLVKTGNKKPRKKSKNKQKNIKNNFSW